MGKDFNKKFNKHHRKPYQKSNNHNKKPFVKRHHDHGTNKKESGGVWQKDSLREDQAGITEYINKGEGFVGILKSRFSDFHVNEIDLNGLVLQLNDTSIPKPVNENELTPEEVAAAKEQLSVIKEDVWDKINTLKESKLDNNKKPEDSAIFIDVTDLDKEQRTQVHKVIKTMYKNKLVSSTVGREVAGSEDADKKFIRVMKSKGRDHRDNFKGYTHFLVHKENLDTSDVATLIANNLNLKPSQVNYCGTKDKRAKTTQKFCIKNRTPSQIVGTVRNSRNITVGNFEFKTNVLKLGDLKGNRFRIALRNLSGNREHMETSLKNIKEQGFINYFGLQRFGNCSAIPTYEVGLALLKADYKLACELILRPRDNDVPFMKSIREMWWKNRNSKEAAAQFHGDRYIEKKLLDGLAQYGENDYAAALRKLPRNMLLLYPHAFQSLIFNNMASKRIKEFGLTLMPGDLVYRNKEDLDIDMETTELETEEQNTAEDNEEKDKETEENDKETESIFKRKVKPLTEEDIKSGSYDIYDVVLPLPGHDITYPKNIVGTWYEEILEKYDLSSEKLKHNVKLFAMAGAYRKLVIKPSDMSWEFRSYTDPNETLILSDVEILKKKTLEDFKVAGETKYEALLLDFCLPPAAYATMMLRELLKFDTSASAQTSLQQSVLNDKRKAEDNDDADNENLVKPAKISKDDETVEESK